MSSKNPDAVFDFDLQFATAPIGVSHRDLINLAECCERLSLFSSSDFSIFRVFYFNHIAVLSYLFVSKLDVYLHHYDTYLLIHKGGKINSRTRQRPFERRE